MGFSGGGTGSGASTLIPIGAVMEYAGDDDPTGWLICDGRSLAESAQPNLFAVIGTTYGGSSPNFNLPDLQTNNKVAAGATDNADLGTTGGVSTVTLTAAQSGLPSHNHNFTTFGGVSNGVVGANLANIQSAANAGTTTTAGPDAAASSHDNKPPFLRLHYIIKV